MSIELLLLKRFELASECTKKLVFPAPKKCGDFVQTLSWMAEHHAITWFVIAIFFAILLMAIGFFWTSNKNW